MAKKNYNLRTRDMYHPLYSTYQLDYLRPNVWEIVIGGKGPEFSLTTTSSSGTTASAGSYISQTSNGNGNRRASSFTSYKDHGLGASSAMSTAASGGLSLYCNKFSLNLPKSYVIQVPWISGVTKLAGRNSDGFTINAEFYAGLGSQSIENIKSGHIGELGAGLAVTDDILRIMYAWRNLCFDARTGQIGLAPSYKKPATLFMYDPSGVQVIYEFTVQGLWPSAIGEIQLDVENNDIVKLGVTFEADFVYLEDASEAMDSFFSPSSDSQAGYDTKGMLYDVNNSTSTSSTSNTSSSGSLVDTVLDWFAENGRRIVNGGKP